MISNCITTVLRHPKILAIVCLMIFIVGVSSWTLIRNSVDPISSPQVFQSEDLSPQLTEEEVLQKQLETLESLKAVHPATEAEIQESLSQLATSSIDSAHSVEETEQLLEKLKN